MRQLRFTWGLVWAIAFLLAFWGGVCALVYLLSS